MEELWRNSGVKMQLGYIFDFADRENILYWRLLNTAIF